ncbi:MAG: hypothetical protein U1E26_05055 [Coriobacteriia bacterium]|nr:hypothetical protein [Coriobacteriia bacterium]
MLLKALVAAALVGTLSVAVGCSGPQSGLEPEPAPIVESPPAESPAAGSRLALGLYELEDGTAQALGTLEWVDLEGGFWAIKGGTEAEGNVGATVAVLANGPAFEQELKPLEGKTVMIVGTLLDGASIRMAGPEIEMTEVTEVSDTIDPAQ